MASTTTYDGLVPRHASPITMRPQVTSINAADVLMLTQPIDTNNKKTRWGTIAQLMTYIGNNLANVNHNLTVTYSGTDHDALKVAGTFAVTGKSAFTGDVTMGGKLNVTGKVTASGDIVAAGIMSAPIMTSDSGQFSQFSVNIHSADNSSGFVTVATNGGFYVADSQLNKVLVVNTPTDISGNTTPYVSMSYMRAGSGAIATLNAVNFTATGTATFDGAVTTNDAVNINVTQTKTLKVNTDDIEVKAVPLPAVGNRIGKCATTQVSMKDARIVCETYGGGKSHFEGAYVERLSTGLISITADTNLYSDLADDRGYKGDRVVIYNNTDAQKTITLDSDGHYTHIRAYGLMEFMSVNASKTWRAFGNVALN